MYEYKAIIRKIYDGDTVTVDIDLGFGVWLFKQSIRLDLIEAAEVRGEERELGLKVRDTLREWLPLGSEVYLVTKKDQTGKYGRWIGIIYPYNNLLDDPKQSESYNERLLLEEGVDPYE